MNYALSGGHAKTLEAAKIILDEGGNAVDAAIASYLVSFISEPCMASIGAGGFAMVHDKSEIEIVDFFCQTPLQKTSISHQEFYPITVDFGSATEDFHVGAGSMAVPGAIAGIYAMHRKWGTMPMKDLIHPALEWAKSGVAIDKFQAYDIHLLEAILTSSDRGKILFTDADGSLKKEGDTIKMPQFADFLEALKHEGEDLVYKGEIAKTIANDSAGKGHLSRTDFENYRAIFRKPIQFDFFGYQVNTPSFPSVGGMLIAALLNKLHDNSVDGVPAARSVAHFQQLVKTFSQISNLKNEPHKVADYLMAQFGINAPIDTNPSAHKWGGTSHFNITDSNGMTVALTTSIGEGAGYFIPGTDMQMNNMLGEEALMPNGFHNWPLNTRLQSMMSPTIITRPNGEVEVSIGSGGAGRIPYAISQVLYYMLGMGMSAEEAIAAPRIHIAGSSMEVERGFDIDGIIIDGLNVWDTSSLFFGGTHLNRGAGKGYRGYADGRRFGAVI